MLALLSTRLLYVCGSCFAILAAIMVVTRKVDWYALSGGRMPREPGPSLP